MPEALIEFNFGDHPQGRGTDVRHRSFIFHLSYLTMHLYARNSSKDWDKFFNPSAHFGFMRHPCHRHGMGCWWLLTPKTGVTCMKLIGNVGVISSRQMQKTLTPGTVTGWWAVLCEYNWWRGWLLASITGNWKLIE